MVSQNRPAVVVSEVVRVYLAKMLCLEDGATLPEKVFEKTHTTIDLLVSMSASLMQRVMKEHPDEAPSLSQDDVLRLLRKQYYEEFYACAIALFGTAWCHYVHDDVSLVLAEIVASEAYFNEIGKISLFNKAFSYNRAIAEGSKVEGDENWLTEERVTIFEELTAIGVSKEHAARAIARLGTRLSFNEQAPGLITDCYFKEIEFVTKGLPDDVLTKLKNLVQEMLIWLYQYADIYIDSFGSRSRFVI